MVFYSDISPVADSGAVERDAPLRNMAVRDMTVQSRPAPRIFSGALRFAGAAFLLAAAGMWIVPTPAWDAQMVLIRLAVSLAFGCFGFLLLHAGDNSLWDEIHLDRQAGELRHVQRGRDGIARLRQSVTLDDVGVVVVDEDTLTLHARSGEIVMEVSGLDRSTLKVLQAGLAPE